jgi:hypothetical protein
MQKINPPGFVVGIIHEGFVFHSERLRMLKESFIADYWDMGIVGAQMTG